MKKKQKPAIKILFLILILFVSNSAEAHWPGRIYSKDPFRENYVTVCNEGNQLGGQLTTYAVVMGYAWSNGIQAYFHKGKLLNIPGGELNYKHIFHRLPQDFSQLDPRQPLHLGFYNGRNPYPYLSGNICICGMPSYPLDYFHPYRAKIRELYQPSEEIMQELRNKYSFLLDHPKTVAVHVRAYTPGLEVHWCLGKDYYESAIANFPDDHLFVVFSDRIGWCKQNLDFKGKNVVFIEGNIHLVDFYLMSFCKNIITANSTFSWWAAYLKQDEEGVILVPEKWFDFETPEQRKTFYPDHYKIHPIKHIPRPNLDIFGYETTSLGD